MNCPVCDRSLAPTLSICPACGAMMNDSVREELQTKISQRLPARPETQSVPQIDKTPLPPRPAMIESPVAKAKPQPTADLVAPKTSPTLVGFQSKNTSVPDWRLQIQNAVQQRRTGSSVNADAGRLYPTNGGAALKAEPVKVAEPVLDIADSRVANAMRRIEESRKAFLEPDVLAKKSSSPRAVQPRPFGIVAPNTSPSVPFSSAKMPVAEKPKLVAPPPPTLERRDTNKLPPIVTAVAEKIERVVPIEETAAVRSGDGSQTLEFSEIRRIRIKAEHEPIVDESTDIGYEDEIEDLAPFSMRFGAGLFDLIIGVFASMLVLSPIAFSRSDWFTTSGMLVFAGTCALVLFVYMTACLGFFGKTMGMRLFSLELVDAVENEYPTLHQAAVSSSVFLVSMLFVGAGFVTIFFNEEKRAVHDLLSGTILVKEF